MILMIFAKNVLRFLVLSVGYLLYVFTLRHFHTFFHIIYGRGYGKEIIGKCGTFWSS